MYTEIVGLGEMQFELGPCLIGGQEAVPFKHGDGLEVGGWFLSLSSLLYRSTAPW